MAGLDFDGLDTDEACPPPKLVDCRGPNCTRTVVVQYREPPWCRECLVDAWAEHVANALEAAHKADWRTTPLVAIEASAKLWRAIVDQRLACEFPEIEPPEGWRP